GGQARGWSQGGETGHAKGRAQRCCGLTLQTQESPTSSRGRTARLANRRITPGRLGQREQLHTRQSLVAHWLHPLLSLPCVRYYQRANEWWEKKRGQLTPLTEIDRRIEWATQNDPGELRSLEEARKRGETDDDEMIRWTKEHLEDQGWSIPDDADDA